MVPIPISALWAWINVWGRVADRDKQIAELMARVSKLEDENCELRGELASYRKLQHIGTVHCDHKGYILKAGDYFAELAGYGSPDELTGKHISTLIPHRYHRAFGVAFKEVSTMQRPLRESPYEGELVCKDSTQIQVLINLTGIVTEGSALQFRADLRRRW